MPIQAYYMVARTPFHLGERGVANEATSVYCHADTLFSALCQTLREISGNDRLKEFLDTYGGQTPALAISSAFPYVAASHVFSPSTVMRLYPRPAEPPPGVDDDPEARKAVKKIAWLSEPLWRAWLTGEIPAACLTRANGPEPAHLRQGGQLWLTPDEAAEEAHYVGPDSDPESYWKRSDAPRVTVDRVSSASAVYQVGRVTYAPGGGLWFLAQIEEDWRDEIEAALHALGDAGLGGERSNGHGAFALHGPHDLPRPLPRPQEKGRVVLLSPCYPIESELPGIVEGEHISYELIARRGWMSSPDRVPPTDDHEAIAGTALRRKTALMFAEGSILRSPDGARTMGKLADVTPDVFHAHRIKRYGLAIVAGCWKGGAGDATD